MGFFFIQVHICDLRKKVGFENIAKAIVHQNAAKQIAIDILKEFRELLNGLEERVQKEVLKMSKPFIAAYKMLFIEFVDKKADFFRTAGIKTSNKVP